MLPPLATQRFGRPRARRPVLTPSPGAHSVRLRCDFDGLPFYHAAATLHAQPSHYKWADLWRDAIEMPRADPLGAVGVGGASRANAGLLQRVLIETGERLARLRRVSSGWLQRQRCAQIRHRRDHIAARRSIATEVEPRPWVGRIKRVCALEGIIGLGLLTEAIIDAPFEEDQRLRRGEALSRRKG